MIKAIGATQYDCYLFIIKADITIDSYPLSNCFVNLYDYVIYEAESVFQIVFIPLVHRTI